MVREGLERLDGVDQVSREADGKNGTCQIRMKAGQRLDPDVLARKLLDLRVGAKLRAVEVTVDGFVAHRGADLVLNCPESGQTFRLADLAGKVQQNPAQRKPWPATSHERRAKQALRSEARRHTGPIRIIGPLTHDAKRGDPVLQVRQFQWFSSARPPISGLTLGIDVNSPYGLAEPWPILREQLHRFDPIEAVSQRAHAATATARIRTRTGAVIDLPRLAQVIEKAGVGAKLRGAELALDGRLQVQHGALLIKTSSADHPIPLAPLTTPVQLDLARRQPRLPTPEESRAYDTFIAQAESRMHPMRIIGPLLQYHSGWLVEIRRFEAPAGTRNSGNPTFAVDETADKSDRGRVHRDQDRTPPGAPEHLEAKFENKTVHLDWTDNSEPDFGSYNLYRSTTPGRGYIQVAAGIADSAYSYHTQETGITYYYVVTATDNAGNQSPFSSEAAVVLSRASPGRGSRSR